MQCWIRHGSFAQTLRLEISDKHTTCVTPFPSCLHLSQEVLSDSVRTAEGRRGRTEREDVLRQVSAVKES